MTDADQKQIIAWMAEIPWATTLIIGESSVQWLAKAIATGAACYALTQRADDVPRSLASRCWTGNPEQPLPDRIDRIVVVGPDPCLEPEQIEKTVLSLFARASDILLVSDTPMVAGIEACAGALARIHRFRDPHADGLTCVPESGGLFRRLSGAAGDIVARYEKYRPFSLDPETALRRAHRAASAGDWMACEAACQFVLHHVPDITEARVLLIEAAVAQGHHEEAANLLADLERQESQPSGFMSRVMRAHAAIGDMDRALSLALQVARQASTSMDDALFAIDLLVAPGNETTTVEQGLSILHELADAHPQTTLPIRKLSAVLERMEQWEECQTATIAALEREPQAPELQRRAILVAAHLEQWPALHRHADALLSLGGSGNVRWLTDVFRRWSVLSERLPTLLELRIRLDPTDSEALEWLGRHHLRENKPDLALPYLEGWLAERQDSLDALILTAYCRYELALFEDALAAVESAVESGALSDPRVSRLYLRLLLSQQDTELRPIAESMAQRPDLSFDQRMDVLHSLDLAGFPLSARQVLTTHAAHAQHLQALDRSYQWSITSLKQWLGDHDSWTAGQIRDVSSQIDVPVQIHVLILANNQPRTESFDQIQKTIRSQHTAPKSIQIIPIQETLLDYLADMANDEYCLLLGPDDTLQQHALTALTVAARKQPDLVTFDHTRHDRFGLVQELNFLPQFDSTWFSQKNYAGRALMVRRELLTEIVNTADWENVLHRQICDRPSIHVAHCPFVLGSLAGTTPRDEEPPTAKRNHTPAVTVIIPTYNRPELAARCFTSVLDVTNYDNLEVIIIDNNSDDPDALAVLRTVGEDSRVRVLSDSAPFNFSDLCNRGAAESTGDVLIFLNNDTEVTDPHWIHELTDVLQDDKVGAVAPALRYPDGTLQHGGVVLCPDGMPRLAHQHTATGMPLSCGRTRYRHEVSALAAACLAVSRSTFDSALGFDRSFAVTYGDVDFCLRLQERGLKRIWTPRTELVHHEGVSARGLVEGFADDKVATRQSDELDLFRARWQWRCTDDPHYSPNLSADGQYAVSDVPRVDPVMWARPTQASALTLFAEPGCNAQSIADQLASQSDGPVRAVLLTEDTVIEDVSSERFLIVYEEPVQRLLNWCLIAARQLQLPIPKAEPGVFREFLIQVTTATHGSVEAFWNERNQRCNALHRKLADVPRHSVIHRETLGADTLQLRTAGILARIDNHEPLSLDSREDPAQWITAPGMATLRRHLALEYRLYGCQ